MENMTLSVSTGIKNIDITDENGKLVYTLKINSADMSIVDRYAKVYDNLNNYSKELADEAREIMEMENGLEKNIAGCKLHVKFLERCIEEIDYIFGEGCIRNIYRACYELNENFVPDEELLIDFLDKVMPIMNEIFKQRINLNEKRYSVNRKGNRR